jgi:predicted NUDIX family NTP pyrophosphohydrolase
MSYSCRVNGLPMMVSAGILLHRRRRSGVEVFLVHPGGPYWAKRDEGAWSVPKGLVDRGEDELTCAKREFWEETGFTVSGQPRDLGAFRLPSGKRLHVWSVEGDCDSRELRSNLFEMEWPPHSGLRQKFPEVDRGAWFGKGAALAKIVKGQRPVIKKFYEFAGMDKPLR